MLEWFATTAYNTIINSAHARARVTVVGLCVCVRVCVCVFVKTKYVITWNKVIHLLYPHAIYDKFYV